MIVAFPNKSFTKICVDLLVIDFRAASTSTRGFCYLLRPDGIYQYRQCSKYSRTWVIALRVLRRAARLEYVL